MSDYDINFWASRPDNNSFWQPYECRQDSHNTSRAILEALSKLDLTDSMTCHEMGANLCRNLSYIQGAYPTWLLSANDVNPHAPAKTRRTYPGLKVDYALESSQDWVKRTAPVDVVLSVSHFIHIEDMTPFIEQLPKVVRCYLILRESAGLHAPGSAYYNHWTIARERDGKSRWFDRDYAGVFDGTSLKLIDRSVQFVFPDTALGHPSKRQYDVYIFQQTGEVEG